MKKYKLLRFRKCYINQDGTFIVGLLGGNKKYGYTFVASHANPIVVLGRINTRSRIVPNDRNWKEIIPGQFNAAAIFHASGYKVKLPASCGQLPLISKY